jgi:hypothetical protein
MRKNWTTAALSMVLVIALLQVLYVLSTGPLWWLHARNYISFDVFFAYSYPILWLVNGNERLSDAWSWYVGWFAIYGP